MLCELSETANNQNYQEGEATVCMLSSQTHVEAYESTPGCIIILAMTCCH